MTLSKLALLTSALVGSLIAFRTFGDEPHAAVAGPRMKLGAYYFAGWSGKNASDDGKPEHAWAKGMPTHVTKRLLTEFPGRTPVWGWRDDTIELMERQIDLAADHGVSFFAFCWYWHDNKKGINEKAIDADSKHLPMRLFTRARNNARMEFCLLVANHAGYEIVGPDAWRQAADHWVSLFKHPRYLRVDGGKPLIVIFQPKGATPENLAYLQEAAKRAGLPGVVVACCGAGRPADGYAVRTYYNVTPKNSWKSSEAHKYSEVVGANLAALAATPDQPLIPLATAGWDRRPWEGPDGFGAKGVPVSWYFEERTPDAFAGLLDRIAKWMDANPTLVTKDRLAMVYAWNEIGEGGWLVPSRDDPDGAYLKAVRRTVLGK